MDEITGLTEEQIESLRRNYAELTALLPDFYTLTTQLRTLNGELIKLRAFDLRFPTHMNLEEFIIHMNKLEIHKQQKAYCEKQVKMLESVLMEKGKQIFCLLHVRGVWLVCGEYQVALDRLYPFHNVHVEPVDSGNSDYAIHG